MNMLKTPCSIKCPDTAYLHKMSSSANGNNLKWQLTTFPPLVFPNGLFVGAVVAKKIG